MYLMEFFVEYLQWLFPTWLLRLGVRYYLYLYGGWAMRCGDVVVTQIELDRHGRGKVPVTEDTDKANEQHYGNDPAFFADHLGPALKYSACEWPGSSTSLADAEVFTLNRYQELAGLEKLQPGSKVLELGCGWGSLTLSNAARFPKLEFTAFSNSPEQIGFIRAQAEQRGLKNIHVHVEDYAVFCTDKSVVSTTAAFDAAMAIETIEHAKDIGTLLAAVAQRLKPGAKMFVQSLLHQSHSYLVDDGDWMGRNFFTGGSILALNSYFHLVPSSLRISHMEPINGVGYTRTLLAWLSEMETKKTELVKRYGSSFYQGFRAFYIVSAEAFAANNGNEYMCGYYVFEKLNF